MRNNYIEILSNKVEIPIIQRDYAQGRTDSKTNKIRKDFLDVLFDFISRKKLNPVAEIELDFIYGFNEVDSNGKIAFVPIDGQQRLTTLWLLHWFIAVKEGVEKDRVGFLANFLYETRHSTTEFCRNLIAFMPDFSSNSIDEEIKNQSWYFDTWNYDPSIQAILVVLKDIESRYTKLNNNSIWVLMENSPFYFYKLDMDKVGLSDDLYIKMNSRGKALTEFEYFKAGFTDLISDPSQRKRFEESVDGKWIDAIWHIIFDENTLQEENVDIALTVDNAFLNLFNFVSSVISFRKDLKDENDNRYINTIDSADLLKEIYTDSSNQNFLFDILDAICNQLEDNPTFWSNTFYFGKDDFHPQKCRLFYQHREENLLKRCLLQFGEHRRFSFGEQILLLACLTHLKSPSNDFVTQIRIVRNLVVNSENQLRELRLGYSFDETEDFILNGDILVLSNFKSDQVEEEKLKIKYKAESFADIETLLRLEDCDILRGCVSIFTLNNQFEKRAQKFLEFFDENSILADLDTISNLLLCFGDYSQSIGQLRNLISNNSSAMMRSFFTTPGFNKVEFFKNTKVVLMDCLDYFIINPSISVQQIIDNKIESFESEPKDWKYYFLKYPSFREYCNQGFYSFWDVNGYCVWKMKERQFNGMNWDPYLYEIRTAGRVRKVYLDNYRSPLEFTSNRKKLLIKSIPEGFQIVNGNSSGTNNTLLEQLINDNVIDSNGNLILPQDKDSKDLVDRIDFLERILNRY